MKPRRPWASADGLPSDHVIGAAAHVGALLDSPSSPVTDARESYWRRSLGGTFGPSDLRLGEELLLDIGLVKRIDGDLYTTLALRSLLEGNSEGLAAAIATRVLGGEPPPSPEEEISKRLEDLVPDPQRREDLLAELGQRFDDSRRVAIGTAGERIVVEAARSELADLGYPELARDVRHLSVETDAAGYDVSAPRLSGSSRLLEVKSTVVEHAERMTIHLSRNESNTGADYGIWAMVACLVTDLESDKGRILGWIPHRALEPALPIDSPHGRWESVAIELQLDTLYPGLPPASN